MKRASNRIFQSVVSFAIVVAGAAANLGHATEWQAVVGAESGGGASQALAFLPNEMWVQTGDTIRWSFPTHEKHTVTFLKPGQVRPAPFGPTWGVAVGCPGLTPDGSSFDGSACVTSDVVAVDDTQGPTAPVPGYSVTFPSTGNFKFVCLVHADMTGVVHVIPAYQTPPHSQSYYESEAQQQATVLLSTASRVRNVAALTESSAPHGIVVAAGVGAIVSTGAGSATASLMRFVRSTITVHVGDTVEFRNLDPSINHTVTFGKEPLDPRPPTTTMAPGADGARQAILNSPTDSVHSGFLGPAAQDRIGLAQAAPGTTLFRVTFKAPGTYNYICANHDDLGMTGTVIVQ